LNGADVRGIVLLVLFSIKKVSGLSIYTGEQRQLEITINSLTIITIALFTIIVGVASSANHFLPESFLPFWNTTMQVDKLFTLLT
jgi:hypothetical protein